MLREIRTLGLALLLLATAVPQTDAQSTFIFVEELAEAGTKRVHLKQMTDLQVDQQGLLRNSDGQAVSLILPAPKKQKKKWGFFKPSKPKFADKSDSIVLGQVNGLTFDAGPHCDPQFFHKEDSVCVVNGCTKVKALAPPDGSRIVLFPPRQALLWNEPPQQIARGLCALGLYFEERVPGAHIALATPTPLLTHPDYSEAVAEAIRKTCSQRMFELLDVHERCTRGSNWQGRYTSDGFLYTSAPISTHAKELSEWLEDQVGRSSTVQESPLLNKDGEAIRYRWEQPSPAPLPVPPFLNQMWKAKEGIWQQIGGKWRGTFNASKSSDLLTYPLNLSTIGPGRLTVRLSSNRSLSPEEYPHGIVSDKDGFSFQLPPSSFQKIDGALEFTYELDESNADIRALDHRAVWSETYRRRCDRFGLSFLCKSKEAVTCRLLETQFKPTPPVSEPAKIVSFEAPATNIPVFGRFEPRFTISGLPSGNYFDPENAQVMLETVAPSGVTNVVHGFLYQDFQRSLEDGLNERLQAQGPLNWRFRYCPTEVGRYRFRVAVRQPGLESWSAHYHFECIEAESPTTFVRLSTTHAKLFEDSTGGNVYPVGLNVHSPIDTKSEKVFGPDYIQKGNEGTYLYERIFAKLGAAGGNTAVVWMAPSWLELEWDSSYPGCHGLTDFHLGRAWQLDKLFDLARANGIRIHLSLENHGKFSTFADAQWKENPYNKKNGGMVQTPDAFFTSVEARDVYQKKLDYLIARWGHDPHLMAIELASKADLMGSATGFGGGPEMRNWHVDTASYLKAKDPNDHLISCHYSRDMRNVDPELPLAPEIDFYGVNAYGPSMGSAMNSVFYNDRDQTAQSIPYATWEFGGSPYGSSRQQVAADVHAGLWSSLFLDSANAPFLWWYSFADRENLYPIYKAFTAFASGVDKRKVSSTYRVQAKGIHRASIQGYYQVYSPLPDQTTLLDGWVYVEKAVFPLIKEVPIDGAEDNPAPVVAPKVPSKFPALPRPGPETREEREFDHAFKHDVALRLPPFPVGSTVTFWDTGTGAIIATQSPKHLHDGMLLRLPPFKHSLAFRIQTASRL